MHYRYYWRERIIREKVMKYAKPGAAGCFEFVGDLIRCKDCMYYNPDPWGYGLCECLDYRRVNEKDFCSMADRKEECTRN